MLKIQVIRADGICPAEVNVSHMVTGHGFGYGNTNCELPMNHLGFHRRGQITWDASTVAAKPIPAAEGQVCGERSKVLGGYTCDLIKGHRGQHYSQFEPRPTGGQEEPPANLGHR